ncbi:restriction endonuclease subunit S [Arachnia propionica]|uniref:restriction endonuclease subunit S n=1 Tax=Arachnia propionica TaxID=1750 RepID=UPI00242C3C83|nr:restriction endonuclease subunit S [Arachnia propionica]
MSRIDKLIADLCPEGVEFRTLKSLARRSKGTSITAARMKVLSRPSGEIRVFAGGKTFADVDASAIPSGDVITTPSIIVRSRGNIDFTYYDKPFSHKSEIWSYSTSQPDVEQRFIYYYLTTLTSHLQEVARATSVKLPQLAVKDTDLLRIPVPPLEVQREIVRALDKFTQLEAELEAELEARRRQYEHYRSALLSFPAGDAKSSTLGELAVRVSSGGTPHSGTPEYYESGNIPWLRSQDINGSRVFHTGAMITKEGLLNSSARWIPKNCVIVAMYGATAARVAINEIPLTTNQACCNIELDSSKADYRYVFFWIANQYETLKALGEGSQSNLNSRKIKSFPILVPPLEEQRRIVSILDRFDSLVNDLSIGLPAELAARRKQYEYYRDRLLTFEEKR